MLKKDFHSEGFNVRYDAYDNSHMVTVGNGIRDRKIVFDDEFSAMSFLRSLECYTKVKTEVEGEWDMPMYASRF